MVADKVVKTFENEEEEFCFCKVKKYTLFKKPFLRADMQNLNCGRVKNTTKFWSRSVSKDALF